MLTVPVEPYPFITAAEFEARVPASQNLSAQAPFRQCLRNAMIVYLRPALTPDLYDGLMAAYRDFVEVETPLPNPYEALLPYVKDTLAYQTLFLLIRNNYAPLRETGTVNLQGQGVVVVDKQEVSRKEQDAMQLMESYQRLMLAFIAENQDSFPLWRDSAKKVDTELSSNGLMVVDVKEDSLRRRRR